MLFLIFPNSEKIVHKVVIPMAQASKGVLVHQLSDLSALNSVTYTIYNSKQAYCPKIDAKIFLILIIRS